MRALVISDTHFGAWTGEDLLRHPEDAVDAAGGLLDLLREKLQGRRLVFLAGNHDHHLISQQAEAVRELELRYPTYTFGRVPCTHGHYLDTTPIVTVRSPTASSAGGCGRSRPGAHAPQRPASKTTSR